MDEVFVQMSASGARRGVEDVGLRVQLLADRLDDDIPPVAGGADVVGRAEAGEGGLRPLDRHQAVRAERADRGVRAPEGRRGARGRACDEDDLVTRERVLRADLRPHEARADDGDALSAQAATRSFTTSRSRTSSAIDASIRARA